MWNLHIRIIFIFLLCGRCIFSQNSNGISTDAQEYVNAHNQIRYQRGLPPLSWDAKLANFAEYWASQRADDCNPFIHSLGNYGENIMWELYNEDSPTQITQGWAAEEKNFDLHWHKCRCQPETTTCKCGHYTQVIWRTTTRIGCGNYTCNNQKGFIVVCSYDPPGNYVDEDPFYPSDYYGSSPSPPSSTSQLPPPPPSPILPPPPPPSPPPISPPPPPPTTTTNAPTPTQGTMTVQPLPKGTVLSQGQSVNGQQLPKGQSVNGQQLNQGSRGGRKKGGHHRRRKHRRFKKRSTVIGGKTG